MLFLNGPIHGKKGADLVRPVFVFPIRTRERELMSA